MLEALLFIPVFLVSYLLVLTFSLRLLTRRDFICGTKSGVIML